MNWYTRVADFPHRMLVGTTISSTIRGWLIAGTLLVNVYAWIQFLNQNYAWPVVILWLTGICAFLMLLAVPLRNIKVSFTEWICFCIVLVVGVFLRLYRLNDVPFGLNHDAGYAGLVSIKALHSSNYLPWSPDPTQGETFFDYWIVLLIALLGPIPLAIKGAAALVGMFTLPAMYLFARKLFGTRVALVATCLMATCGWHLIFSRVGWRVITLPLVETLAFYFLFQAFETRHRGSFATAGALFALLLNTYLAARILPILAIVWALVELWRAEDRRTLLYGYGLALVGFLMAGAAVLAFALTNPEAINARYDSVSIVPLALSGDWSYFWRNLIHSFGLFTVRANGDDFFIDQPLLDPPTSWFFLLGLVLAVWWAFKRSRRYLFIVLGLVMAMLPGLVAIAPNGNRDIGTMPFVLILAALPLVAVLDAADHIRPRFPALFHRLPEVAVAAALIASVVITFNQYLGPDRTELWGFYPETSVVGNYIKEIDKHYDVYLTDNYPRDALTYITYEPGDPLNNLQYSSYDIQPHYTWQEKPQDFFADSARPGRGLAFFMFPGVPENETTLQALQARYPNAVVLILPYHYDAINRPASLVVLVPPT